VELAEVRLDDGLHNVRRAGSPASALSTVACFARGVIHVFDDVLVLNEAVVAGPPQADFDRGLYLFNHVLHLAIRHDVVGMP
jgi:hypothetical protein